MLYYTAGSVYETEREREGGRGRQREGGGGREREREGGRGERERGRERGKEGGSERGRERGRERERERERERRERETGKERGEKADSVHYMEYSGNAYPHPLFSPVSLCRGRKMSVALGNSS